MRIGFLVSFPQKGLACTIVINVDLSSKFASQLLTTGPMAMLATDGAENSQIILLAMAQQISCPQSWIDCREGMLRRDKMKWNPS
jgi:hypothetical protein